MGRRVLVVLVCQPARTHAETKGRLSSRGRGKHLVVCTRPHTWPRALPRRHGLVSSGFRASPRADRLGELPSITTFISSPCACKPCSCILRDSQDNDSRLGQEHKHAEHAVPRAGQRSCDFACFPLPRFPLRLSFISPLSPLSLFLLFSPSFFVSAFARGGAALSGRAISRQTHITSHHITQVKRKQQRRARPDIHRHEDKPSILTKGERKGEGKGKGKERKRKGKGKEKEKENESRRAIVFFASLVLFAAAS